MRRGYKVRIFPTQEQEELLWKHIHACRFIWNYMLNYQEQNHNDGNEYLGDYDLIRLLPVLKSKQEYSWLYDVNATSLQIICRDVHKAYINYFKYNKRHPKYKTKKSKQYVYPVNQSVGRFYFDEDYITIPSIKKVRYKTTYVIPFGKQVKFINPRISYINNKWILSFSLEFENQEQKLNDFNMGIDLGVKELAVVVANDIDIVYHNINKSKRVKTLKHKLQHIQRVINRKYKINNNYEKTNAIKKYEKIQREIYYKLANIRKNYIHQITHELVSMLPQRVVMEDLNVSGLMKNRCLSKAIAEQCLYEFIRQMKYKCEWAGIEFVQADRFYPSSKTCSRCGEIKKDLKLSDRVYKCSCCGLEIDRDYNAAINLMNYSY